jgi:hypothetical protein
MLFTIGGEGDVGEGILPPNQYKHATTTSPTGNLFFNAIPPVAL